jgi:hypothetical protein
MPGYSIQAAGTGAATAYQTCSTRTWTRVPFSRDSNSPLEDSDLRVKDSDMGHVRTRKDCFG